MAKADMLETLHPDPTKQGTRVTKSTYAAYRAALLAVIPASEDGIEFVLLRDAVIPLLPADIVASTSPGWWTTTVKLDLEARGLIERTGHRGRQRVRRCA